MILVDSSVWIDYLRSTTSREVDLLGRMIGTGNLVSGDLIVTEVLQGCTSEAAYGSALLLLTSSDVLTIGGKAIALQAARNYRTLRSHGITVRKTIDTLIATRCIMDGHALLYSDRDFDPFVEHLGLRSALAA